jgi:hypothetical protein
MVILVRAEAIDIPRSIFEEVSVIFLGIDNSSEVIEALPRTPAPLRFALGRYPLFRGYNSLLGSSEHFQKFSIFSSKACIDYAEC